eukprot:GHVT01007541.1.p1 GENE.GHVT01007541.1~~GHVT01007541.1.p1  ORF type:complete len:160 (-),score=26.71 GHVT01007541.1:169-648(-)
MKRIQESGGQVLRLDGDIPYRVFIRGQLYPGLAMSRALGDTLGGKAGVIAEPDIQEYSLDHRDVFLTICSDGVWEFISSADAVAMITEFGIERVQAASEYLARQSQSRWIHEEQNVVDDITVEIIYFNAEKYSHTAVGNAPVSLQTSEEQDEDAQDSDA